MIATTREIAKATGTSLQTVITTLKILEEGNIIKRKTGVLMLNPELLMRGDDQKQKYLLLEFGNFEQEANEKQENALSDYYSFKDQYNIKSSTNRQKTCTLNVDQKLNANEID